MTPETVLAMRKAATLAFAVPGLEVDIRCGRALVARVQRRFDRSQASSTTTLLAPCAFRAAVGRLIADGTGERSLFLGLRADAALGLDYFMPLTGAAHPLGLIVSRVGETVVHVFATGRARCDVDAIIREIGYHPSLPHDVIVQSSHDEMTRVSLVYCETRICDTHSIRPSVEAMMSDLFVRLGVDEITEALVVAAARSSEPT